MDGAPPANWSDAAHDYIAQLQAGAGEIASRKASQNALNAYGPPAGNCWAGRPIWRRATSAIGRVNIHQRGCGG